MFLNEGMKGGTIRTVDSSSLDVVGCHVTFWACPCFGLWPAVVFGFNGFDDFSELGGHCLLVLVDGVSQDKEVPGDVVDCLRCFLPGEGFLGVPSVGLFVTAWVRMGGRLSSLF